MLGFWDRDSRVLLFVFRAPCFEIWGGLEEGGPRWDKLFVRQILADSKSFTWTHPPPPSTPLPSQKKNVKYPMAQKFIILHAVGAVSPEAQP